MIVMTRHDSLWVGLVVVGLGVMVGWASVGLGVMVGL